MSKLVICELQLIIEKKTTKEAFVRGDYKHCAENTLALLGSAPDFFITNLALFPTPDGWAKCYTAKNMLMWSDQLPYDGEFVKKP